jgi:hypothetical protein
MSHLHEVMNPLWDSDDVIAPSGSISQDERVLGALHLRNAIYLREKVLKHHLILRAGVQCASDRPDPPGPSDEMFAPCEVSLPTN